MAKQLKHSKDAWIYTMEQQLELRDEIIEMLEIAMQRSGEGRDTALAVVEELKKLLIKIAPVSEYD